MPTGPSPEYGLPELFDTHPVPMWVYDTETLRFLAVNPAMVAHYGFSADEFLGMTLEDILPPEDVPVLRHHLTRTPGNPRYHSGPWRHRTNRGATFTVETTSHPLTFDGRPARLVMVIDQTERRRVEAERDRLLAHYELILERMPLACVMNGPDLAVRFWNPAAEHIFGFTKAEVVGKLPFDTFVPAAEQAGVDAILRSVLAGESNGGASEHLTRDGRRIVCEWTNTPLHDADGKLAGILSMAQDVTERARAEATVRQSAAHFRALAEGLPLLVWTCLGDGYCDYLSPQWLAYTGETEATQVGAGWLDRLHPDDRAATVEAWTRAVAASSQYEVEFRLRRADGQYRWFQTRAVPLKDAAGAVVRWFGTNTDIDDRRRAEEEREALIRKLEDQNAELERFVYTVSHDLKSPLITIKGFLGHLDAAARAGNWDRFTADLGRVSRAADRMHALLNDLLQLSRVGRVANPPRNVPLAASVAEAIQQLDGAVTAGNVAVEVEPDLPSVFADPARVTEVFVNLIGNAVKFAAGGPAPHVRVGFRPADGAVFVRDNGIGIDPAHHARVFNLFERLNPNTEGTGVGLAIVKRIVDVHGGRVWIESDGQDRGTTVCLTLPGPR